MDQDLIHLVWRRASFRCEYCLLPQSCSLLPFEIDHVIARKHGGASQAANLALSCFYDNSFKGSNIAGIDPRTGYLTPLFHPRRHKWDRHFRWRGPVLVGRTAIGRATIATLLINLDARVAHRQALIDAGRLILPRR